MNAHDELDNLSAYLDGELNQAERARLDAHLPGCAECRTTLDALHATAINGPEGGAAGAQVPAPKAQRGPHGQAVAPLAAPNEFSAIAPSIPDAKTQSQLDTCVGIVRGAHEELVTPFRYESATFDE